MSLLLYKYTEKWGWQCQGYQIPVTAQAGACRIWNGQKALQEGCTALLQTLFHICSPMDARDMHFA